MDARSEQMLLEYAEERRTRFSGKYRGTVSDDRSGGDLGKLRVKVPDVYDDQDSPVAWPCVPFAGPNHGFVAIPEVDDGVWVEFEAGDPSRPIWVGSWFAQGDMPSPSDTNVRTLITSGGLKLVMDDGANELRLEHPDGAKLSLTSDGITLSMNSTTLVLSADGISMNDVVTVTS